MKKFGGKVLFLDRSDINTDEIIPARYLTEITKEALKPYLLEDLEMDGFKHPDSLKGMEVIITRENFGCGSSREHAPWALEVNGINLVIAENFARIFRQNMFNCGMIACTMSKADIEDMFRNFAGSETTCNFDLENGKFTLQSVSETREYNVELGSFEKELVTMGGWVEFADSKY